MPKTIFPTDKRESFQSKQKRWLFNLVPAYRRSGGRVIFISDDWKEIHVKLSLNWRTRNYVGTVFGGSIYAALDPIYMVQLIQLLGKAYIVWDKAAEIKFIKPIKSTVYARFVITDDLIDEIKAHIAINKKMNIQLPVTFQDEQGTVYAQSIKTLYIAEKTSNKPSHS